MKPTISSNKTHQGISHTPKMNSWVACRPRPIMIDCLWPNKYINNPSPIVCSMRTYGFLVTDNTVAKCSPETTLTSHTRLRWILRHYPNWTLSPNTLLWYTYNLMIIVILKIHKKLNMALQNIHTFYNRICLHQSNWYIVQCAGYTTHLSQVKEETRVLTSLWQVGEEHHHTKSE